MNCYKKLVVAACAAVSAIASFATEGVADKWKIIGSAVNNVYSWYEVDENGDPVANGWVLGVTWDSARDRITISGAVKTIGTASVLDFTNTGLVGINDTNNSFKNRTFLTEVRFPATFESLGSSAFTGCTSLTNVSFGGASSALVKIGGSAFSGCTSLRTVTPLLPEGLRQLDGSAFYNCPLEGDLRVGYGAAYPFAFGESVFRSNTGAGVFQLKSVDIGPMVTKIAHYCFQCAASNGTLRTVKLSDSLSYLGSQVFYNCKTIENFVNPIPTGLTSASASWRQCRLPKTVRYNMATQNNVEKMFEGATGMERVILGEKFSCVFTKSYMFYGCKDLKYIDFKSDVVPQFTTGSGTLYNGNGEYAYLITVPADGANWKAVLADATQVTPWAEVDQKYRDKFTANFPDDPAPLGLIIANWGTQTKYPNTFINQWITTDTKGAWTSVRHDGAKFVAEVQRDPAKAASIDIAVRVTDADGVPTTTTLATGVTSAEKIAYAIPGLTDGASHGTEILVTSSDADFGAADLGGVYAGTVELSSSGSIDIAADGSATITVTRGDSAAATANPLTVNLALSGTAVADEDYVSFVPAITIPAGASSASVTIAPLYNADADADRTLTVSLADGGYRAGATTSVSIAATKPSLGWTLATTSSTVGTLTEVVESGTAWVIPVSISDTDLTLKAPTTVGTSTVLDFRKLVATAAGVRYKIVSNADGAFKNKTTITELYLPESMTTVYNSFCYGCTGLTKVQLSSKTQKICGSAFYNCYNIREVTPFLPETVIDVAGSAFYNCYRLATPLRIGFGLTPSGATLPMNLSGTQSFKQCKAIPTLEIGPGITILPNETFSTCSALASVTMHDNIVSIGSSCFNSCSALATVTPFLPTSLAWLDQNAFYKCTSLQGSLSVGSKVRFTAGGNTSNGMFDSSLITSATVDNMATLSGSFFRNCKSLTDVTISDATTVFDSDAFLGCTALETLTLPKNLTKISSGVFNGCSALTTVTPFLPETVSYIGQNAFYNCKKLEGELRFALGLDSAQFGGASSFISCSKLTKAYLGDAITKIPKDTFNGCSGLTYVKLPAGLTDLSESGIFSGCTSLATVEPLLPAGVAGSIGGSCFNSAPIEGELYVATNGTALTVGSNVFKGARVTKVVFGDNVTSIGQDCFNGDKYIESLVLPKNLQKFDGTGIFSGCTALKEVENFLPLTLTKVSDGVFNGCTSLNLPVKFWPASSMATGATVFYNQGSKGVTEIDLGTNVTAVGKQFLEGTKSVKRIVMRNTMTFQSNSFNSWNDYQCAFVIHRDQTTWNGADISGVLTAWDGLDDDIKAKYTAAYPGEPDPRGVIADAKYPKRQWIVSYGIVTPGVKSLTVNGFPQQYGASLVSPAYGGNKNITVPMSVSAPRYAPEGNVLYGCEGYVLEISGDYGWENPVTNRFAAEDSRTISYTTDTDGDKRLSWLWEPAAYSITVVQPTDPTIGSATVSQGSLEGYFKIGETATITAVDGTGTFVRWHGDVPAGHETDRVLSVLIDGPKNITPEFASPWTYDSSKKTLSDGCWTLNVDLSKGKYTIKSVATVYDLGVLDLTKKMSAGDSSVITAIGNDVFKNSAILVEVRLPDTLEKIQPQAFLNCVNLKTVTPFLPPSVKYIGLQAFAGCTSLEGDLVLRADGGDLEFNSSGQFSSTAISSVTFGPEMTTVGSGAFSSCTKLTSVTLSENVTAIYSEAFRGCTALETVTPLLPASLVKIQQGAFYQCSKLGGIVYVGTNGVPVKLEGGSYGAFAGSAVTEIHLGEGVRMIPNSFGRDNKMLTTLTMSETVTNINTSAFRTCASLKTVKPLLPADLQYLGHEAFNDCPKLGGDAAIGTNGVEVTLQANGSYGGLRNTGITSLYVGKGLKKFESDGFCGYCTALTNVVFEDGGVTNIGNNGFRDCTALKSVRLPKGLETLGNEAFRGCSALKTITPFLPDSIVSIGKSQFYGCSALASPLVLEAKKRQGVRPAITLVDGNEGSQFRECGKIPSVTIGNVSALPNASFNKATSVKEFYIKSTSPFTVTGSNAFEGWSDRQSRWYVPRTGWESWLEANVTKWVDVSSEDKDFYHESYPGAKDAYGYVNGYQKCGKQWVILWNPESTGFTIVIR